MHLHAQENIQSEAEKLFASTFWEPNKGVKLLKASSAKKTWLRYQKKCELPKLFHDRFPVQEHYVFRTDNHVIFVYNLQMLSGPYWSICSRHDKSNLFESKNFAGGYETREDGTLRLWGQCIEGPGMVYVRFRPYEKDKLFLEMKFHVCQSTEINEFLFHLDEKNINEVKGTRLTFYELYKTPLIYWNYYGDEHRIKNKSWNEDGELTWSRKLEVTVRDKSEPAVWNFQCKYDKSKREVICDKELVKGSKITRWVDEHHDCALAKERLNLIPKIESLGITVSSEVKTQLKEEKSKWCDKSK